jgi:hypothetical protein
LSLLRPLERSDDPVTPSSALAAAAGARFAAPVFNGEGFGGYLTFRGILAFIEGRQGRVVGGDAPGYVGRTNRKLGQNERSRCDARQTRAVIRFRQ